MNRNETIAALPAKGAYAQLLRDIARHGRARPDAVTRNPFDVWRGDSTVREIRQEARRALHRRINARAGHEWRNVTTAGDVELQRDRRDLDSIIRDRVRVYQFRTARMRARFGALLASHND